MLNYQIIFTKIEVDGGDHVPAFKPEDFKWTFGPGKKPIVGGGKYSFKDGGKTLEVRIFMISE